MGGPLRDYTDAPTPSGELVPALGDPGIVTAPMPTYMYKFVKTGETIEVHQSFHDDALTQIVHPGTGRRMAVKKVFTPVGVTFKGGGFYKTDSRGKSTSTSTVGDSKSGDSKSGDSTTDSKNGDSKTGDTKTGDTKAGTPKPADSTSASSASKSAEPTTTRK